MGRNGILSMGALGTVRSSYFFNDCFKWRCHLSRNDVAKSSVCLAVVLVAQSILFTNLFDRDNCFRHMRSSRSDLRVNPRLHRNGSQELRTVNCGPRTETVFQITSANPFSVLRKYQMPIHRKSRITINESTNPC